MTDHMLVCTHSPESGWSAPVIKPYGPLELDPASSGKGVRPITIFRTCLPCATSSFSLCARCIRRNEGMYDYVHETSESHRHT
jgi:hypothetical protein